MASPKTSSTWTLILESSLASKPCSPSHLLGDVELSIFLEKTTPRTTKNRKDFSCAHTAQKNSQNRKKTKRHFPQKFNSRAKKNHDIAYSHDQERMTAPKKFPDSRLFSRIYLISLPTRSNWQVLDHQLHIIMCIWWFHSGDHANPMILLVLRNARLRNNGDNPSRGFSAVTVYSHQRDL